MPQVRKYPLIKTCTVCDKEYRQSKVQKNGKQFAASLYCSMVCRAIGQVTKRLIEKPDVSEFSGGTRQIGQFLVNEEYYDWLSQWSWYQDEHGYAVFRGFVNGKKAMLRMHRLIVDAPDDKVVDHINRIRSDNRVQNLRIVTQKVNANNSFRVDNAKYYYFVATTNRWIVDSRKHGVRSKPFDTEQDAIDYVKNMKKGF